MIGREQFVELPIGQPADERVEVGHSLLEQSLAGRSRSPGRGADGAALGELGGVEGDVRTGDALPPDIAGAGFRLREGVLRTNSSRTA